MVSGTTRMRNALYLHWFVLLVVALVNSAAHHSLTRAQSPPDTLSFGVTLRRDLRGGDSTEFVISARRGDYVEIAVRQLSRNLSIALRRSRGGLPWEVIYDGDVPVEMIRRIVPTTGIYALQVTSLADSSTHGPFEVALREQRPASKADRVRVQADSLYRAGLVTYRAFTPEAYRAAAPLLTRAAALWSEVGEPAWRGWALHRLGLAELAAGKLEAARAALADARRAFASINDTAGEANVLLSLGVTAVRENRVRDGIALFEQALPLAAAAADSASMAFLLNELGNAQNALGENARALPYFGQAVAINRALGNTSGLDINLNNEATTLSSLGRYEQALEFARESLRLRRERKNGEAIARTLNNLGTILETLRRTREAQDYFTEALAEARAVGGLFELEGTILSNMAGLIVRERPADAARLYEESLSLKEKAGDVRGAGTTAYNLGNLYTELDSLQKARANLQKALAIFTDSVPNSFARSVIIGVMGRVLFKSGDRLAAIQQLRASISLSDSLQDRRTKARTLLFLATYQRELEQLDSARRTIAESLHTWEELRRSIEARGLRTSFASQIAAYYDFAVDLEMRLAARDSLNVHIARALNLAEQSRARTLLESLQDTRAQLRSRVDSTLLAREWTLEQQIGGVSAEAGGAAVAGRQLDSLIQELDLVRARIRRAVPRLAAVSSLATFGVAEVQTRLLDSASVLLHYHIGEDAGYLFVVRTDTIAAYPLPRRVVLDTMVRGYLADLAARAETSGPILTQQRAIVTADSQLVLRGRLLATTLLEPAMSLVVGRRMLISPSEGLHYVPFAALPTPGEGDRPLLASHEIVYLPSASSAALLAARSVSKGPTPKQLALIGDPIYSPGDDRVTRSGGRIAQKASTPLPAGDSAKNVAVSDTVGGDLVSAARSVGLSMLEPWLPRLAFARREVEAIAALVPTHERTVILDFDASLARVLGGALAGHRIIHIASHALMNDERPELSGIALTGIAPDGQLVDGFLRLHHLYQLDLPAELVVLSACQTAIGTRFEGEGPASLARGFLQAGAARVVSSLWKVDDQATAELMTRFYRLMLGRQQLTPAAALRAAQLELRHDPRWNAPFFWAAFTLQGEWR